MSKEQSIVYRLDNIEEVKAFLDRKCLIKNKKLYVRTPMGNQEVRVGDTIVKNYRWQCYVVRGTPFKGEKKG